MRLSSEMICAVGHREGGAAGMPLTAAMSTAFPDEWCNTLPELV
jgi:hypothetical protein